MAKSEDLIRKTEIYLKLRVNKVMTKNPITIEKNDLAAKALSLMNNKKITSLCVFDKKDKKKQLAFSMFTQYFNQIYLK